MGVTRERHGETVYKLFKVQKYQINLEEILFGIYISVFIFSFLQTILKKILEGINVRKEMGEKSQKEQEKKYNENKKKISLLKSECNKVTIYYGILSCN